MEQPQKRDPEAVDARPVPAQSTVTQEAVPTAYPVEPAKLMPVERDERFITLDVLRGVAVLGILLVNIFSFSRMSREALDWQWSMESPFDSLTFVCLHFFVSQKFITLFSLLFGMGLALQYERARLRHRPFVGLYSRRLIVLLVFGALHGTLLWHGDILLTYALVGFIALLLRGLKARTLLAISLFVFLLPMLAEGGLLSFAPHLLERGQNDYESRARYAEEQCADCDLEGNPPSLFSRGETPHEKSEWEFRHWCFLWDEERVYQSGTWMEAMTYRFFQFKHMTCDWGHAFHGLRSLALFLLGMALVKWRLFQDRDGSRSAYSGMILYGLIAGIPLSAVAVWLDMWEDPAAGTRAFIYTCAYVGSLGMSLAYAGALALLCLRVPWRKWLRPLASVGQMGLSNYLGQSIICGLIFYGCGLGLFNKVGAVLTVLIAFGIFILQLVVSSIWLRYFRFGPFEWLWRTLTYLKLQPMRRKASPPWPVAAVAPASPENPGSPLTR